MTSWRLAALSFLACIAVAAEGPARAGPSWMTEDAMRAAFIGKTLDGHYVDGMKWSETYDPNGRLDYREEARAGAGRWFFRRHVFCTFYDPGQELIGGCFAAVQAGANCYEFYLASLTEPEVEEDEAPGPAARWVARASRRGEPSTCEARPSV